MRLFAAFAVVTATLAGALVWVICVWARRGRPAPDSGHGVDLASGKQTPEDDGNGVLQPKNGRPDPASSAVTTELAGLYQRVGEFSSGPEIGIAG